MHKVKILIISALSTTLYHFTQRCKIKQILIIKKGFPKKSTTKFIRQKTRNDIGNKLATLPK